MRYVRLSFAAKGNRIFLFPAMLPSPGLLVRLATAGSFSGRWSDGRRGGFLSSSVRAARMAVCVQWIQGAGMVLGAGSCSYYQALGVLQHGGRRILPDFRLRELPKMTMETLPGVCVNTLCTGVFPTKKQGCIVCLFNTVSLSQKKTIQRLYLQSEWLKSRDRKNVTAIGS